MYKSPFSSALEEVSRNTRIKTERSVEVEVEGRPFLQQLFQGSLSLSPPQNWHYQHGWAVQISSATCHVREELGPESRKPSASLLARPDIKKAQNGSQGFLVVVAGCTGARLRSQKKPLARQSHKLSAPSAAWHLSHIPIQKVPVLTHDSTAVTQQALSQFELQEH